MANPFSWRQTRCMKDNVRMLWIISRTPTITVLGMKILELLLSLAMGFSASMTCRWKSIRNSASMRFYRALQGHANAIVSVAHVTGHILTGTGSYAEEYWDGALRARWKTGAAFRCNSSNLEEKVYCLRRVWQVVSSRSN